jgi:hypothetical protein
VPRHHALTGALLAGTLLLTACSGQGNAQQDAAAAVAVRFLKAQAADPQTACDLLAPQTLEEVQQDGAACTEALPAKATDSGEAAVPSVEVYGKDAIARFAKDTVFLALFADGWKVTAANCQESVKDRPFDCSVKGK